MKDCFIRIDSTLNLLKILEWLDCKYKIKCNNVKTLVDNYTYGSIFQTRRK